MTLYCLTPREWEQAFAEFADLATDKHYRKIKYTDYKELHKLWVSAYGVAIKHDGSSIIVEVFRNNDMVHIYCFNSSDESLGAFLYENYIMKGKWLRMSYTTSKLTDEELAKVIKSQLMSSTACTSCSADTAISTADIKKSIDWLNDATALTGKAATGYYYDCDGTARPYDKTTIWAGDYTVPDYGIANYGTTNLADVSGYNDKFDTKADIDYVNEKIDEAFKKHENENKIFNEKENENMKGFNFDFGPCTGDNVRLSMYGLAVKNAAGTYVSYNSKSKEIVDVDILNFDGGKYMYKFPVALSQVAVGDVVIHNRKPMFVIALDEVGKNLTVVDVCAGEQKTVIPTVNMFGFNFITKIVSLFDMSGGMATASEAQPFGNMLPLMLMGDNKDIDPMMLMMLMGGGDMSALTANPMMLYLMMKDGKGKDMDPLMLMFMMNQPHKCKCGCHDDKDAEAPTV